MKPVWVTILGLVFISLLVGCGKNALENEEKFEPEIVVLQVTPAVEHWLPRVANCAGTISDFGIYTQFRHRADLSLGDSDLILRLGQREEDDPFVVVMGVEKVVLVAGGEVPVNSISLVNLQAIYAGEITDWGNLAEAELKQDEEALPIKTLAYPVTHEISTLFAEAFLSDVVIQTKPQIYATVAFLEELLILHPGAIGYLLESQVPEGMRKLSITADAPIANEQYVLAVSAKAPEGRLKALLTCLQSGQ